MLRKATEADYEVYKELFEDEEFKYQWMYYDPDVCNKISKSEIKADMEEFGLPLDEYICTLEKFRRNLEIDDIYMIEVDGKIKGYLEFFSYGTKGIYKLANWAMFEDDEDLKKSIVQEFKSIKLRGLKKIHVCTIHKPAVEFFQWNGFVDIGGAFYELTIIRKKKNSSS